jgi:hypothetical protein
MASYSLGRWLIISALFLAFVLRLGMWWINPPNNSFDDHLEPIAYYALNYYRPPPSHCWECYQPPLYYVISSGVLHLSYSFFSSFWESWRSVQLISTISSCSALMIITALLQLLTKKYSYSIAITILLLAILPRDLYTSSIIGNDALLVLWVSLAVFSFCLIILKKNIHSGSIILLLSCILAAWTKQSGIITLVLPLTILFAHFSSGETLIKLNREMLFLYSLAIVIAVIDEIWRWSINGIPLLSNQHFFNWAEQQPPGNTSIKTFTTFKLVELFRTPVLSNSTNNSFWTQIFGRIWFDYETRFLPTKEVALWAARAMFLLGLSIFPVLLLGLRCSFSKIPKQYAWGLLILVSGFTCAAIMQTIRFPFFSSMKAVFILPCVSVICIWIALGLEKIIKFWLGRMFCLGITIYAVAAGLYHWILVLSLNEEALGLPTSPIWSFPQLW